MDFQINKDNMIYYQKEIIKFSKVLTLDQAKYVRSHGGSYSRGIIKLNLRAVQEVKPEGGDNYILTI